MLLIGLGGMVCLSYGEAEAAAPDFDPLALGFWSLNFAQLAVVVFAVLAVGNEYGTGTIRSSLAAVPRRGGFYASKLLVGAGLALAVALPAAVLTFVLTQSLLGEHGVAASDAVRAIVALVLYFPLLTLLCMGVTTMLRSTMASMSLLVPFVFLVSPLCMEVSYLRNIVQFLPDRAGQLAAMSLRPDPDIAYAPWVGTPIMAAWTVAALLGGWAVLRARDA